jgi:hypothetical protein
MIRRNLIVRRRWIGLAVLVACGATQFGIISGCNNLLLGTTDYFDPCGTILGNCEPGDFQVYNSGPGAYCIDPTCTIPGQCENEGPPLGTLYDLCP